MEEKNIYYAVVNKKELANAYINLHTKNKKEELSETLLARHLLEYLLEHFNLEKRKICYSKYGKPYFKDANLYFNYSHSKKYIACAISNTEIGVDIEERNREVPVEMEKRIYTSEEIKNKKKSDVEQWVIKEAYAKYLGLGLTLPFNTISENEIKKRTKCFNLSQKDYYCYIIGDRKLRKAEVVKFENLR